MGCDFYPVLVREEAQESPLRLNGSPGRLGEGLHRVAPAGGGLGLRARRSRERPGLGNLLPPSGVITVSSCFCLALQGSVCPNPRPLSGLHLSHLPSFPASTLPPPSTPTPQPPGQPTPQRRRALRFRSRMRELGEGARGASQEDRDLRFFRPRRLEAGRSGGY